MNKGGKIIGYTSGVFDLFHVGHLNILKNARALCDYLIVGVTTDEVTYETKNKWPVIPFKERIKIVKSNIFVDKAVKKKEKGFNHAWEKYHFNLMIKGDDWKGSQKGNAMEEELKKVGVSVVYFPYTQATSSSRITELLSKLEDLERTEEKRDQTT